MAVPKPQAAPTMMSKSKIPTVSTATSIQKATAKAKNNQANQVALKAKLSAYKPSAFSNIAKR